MDQAYDLKALVLSFKDKGLDVAEDGAKVIVEKTFDWLIQSAKLSVTPYDDLLVALYPILKAQVLVQVDKIDGKPG